MGGPIRRSAEGPAHRLDGLSHRIKVVASAALAATSVEEALRGTLKLICEETGWPVGHVLRVTEDGRALISTGIWSDVDPALRAGFVAATAGIRFGAGEGMPGTILERGQPLWVPDLGEEASYPRGISSAGQFPPTTRSR